LFIQLENVEILSVSDELQNASSLNSGRPVVQYNNDRGVIHPNGIAVNIGAIRVRRADGVLPIKAYIRIYCDGSRMVEKTLQVPPMS